MMSYANTPQIVSFGEILLRLTPDQGYKQLVDTDKLKVGFAGAEANVAVALSVLGHDSFFVSRLPVNDLGQAAVNSLRAHGVNTDFTLRRGSRIGTYFIEYGASIRPSKIIYDRQGSAMATLESGEFRWSEILKEKTWLHITGITPALSQACAEETVKAAKTAKQLGLTVSFDMNFRRNLWQNSGEAKVIFDEILPYTDLLIANEGALADVYQLVSDKDHPEERSRELMHVSRERFEVDTVAFTLRNHFSASENGWSGLFLTDKKVWGSKNYRINVVDRLGTGDAFAAGIIHGVLSDFDPQKIIDFATALSGLKHTVPGDLSLSTEKDIFSIMKGNILGHIQR